MDRHSRVLLHAALRAIQQLPILRATEAMELFLLDALLPAHHRNRRPPNSLLLLEHNQLRPPAGGTIRHVGRADHISLRLQNASRRFLDWIDGRVSGRSLPLVEEDQH